MTTKEVAELLNIGKNTILKNAKKIGKVLVRSSKGNDWTDEEIDLLRKQLEENQKGIGAKTALNNTKRSKSCNVYRKTAMELYREKNPEFDGVFIKELAEELNYKKCQGLVKFEEPNVVMWKAQKLNYFTKEQCKRIKERVFNRSPKKDLPEGCICAKEALEKLGRKDLCTLRLNPLAHHLNESDHSPVYFKEEDLDKIKECGRSNIEKEIANWLKQYIEVEESNRSILNGKELDIYVPSKKVAIEMDGLFWYSSLYRDKNFHYWKFDECRKQGIRLIHIFEDEWRNKQEIVKSLLLSSIGIYSRKVFARKCVVKEIEHTVAKEFLEVNHINGHVNCNRAFGLFYKDELLQVITVGLNRFSKEKKLELLN